MITVYHCVTAIMTKEGTDVPVVRNSSFDENERIVCTPDEAGRCLQRTRMDALAIGNFLVEKEYSLAG